MGTGQLLWSVAVLMLCVGFGGFYLAKQLGWFGGLAIERLGGGVRRWSRWRRRLMAVLCILLGVMFFLGANWIDPRTHPLFFGGFALVLLVLSLVAFVLGIQELREVRNLGRRLRSSRSHVSPDRRSRSMSQPRRPGGGNGDSPGENRAGREPGEHDP